MEIAWWEVDKHHFGLVLGVALTLGKADNVWCFFY